MNKCDDDDDDDDDIDDGDDNDVVSAVGLRRRVGLTVRGTSWPTLSIRAWTTACAIVRRWSTSTRSSAATDSPSPERTATADLIR